MRTLYQELEKWLIYYKKNSVKPSTYKRYQSVLKLIGKYDIGRIGIEELKTWHVQSYINDLVDSGYSKETIGKQYKILSEFVDYALNEDLIRKPICSQAKLPKESVMITKKREVVAYSADEQDRLRKILERGDNPSFYAAILMLETGMRSGEVLALTWSDIDFKKRCVSINKTTVCSYNKKDSRYVQMEPKTPSSIRKIPLSKNAMKAVEKLKSDDDGLSEYLFHDKDGVCFTYFDLRWWIRKACNEANVPYYGQHVFRHTFATNCYYKGCDVKLLSKMLGHSNASITYNTYIHLYGDALEEMRSILD